MGLFPTTHPAHCSKRITFQHTFPLPRKGRPRTNPRVPAKKHKSVPKKAKATDAKRQRPKKVTPPKGPTKKRLPLMPEARKERQRFNHKQHLAKAKTLGLCRHCAKPAIEGQTRYDRCAEKHRASYQVYSVKRHAKAKEAGQLRQAIALAENIAAGGPTKCRHCKNPPHPGQTRCERCANRHNEYRTRSEGKKTAYA